VDSPAVSRAPFPIARRVSRSSTATVNADARVAVDCTTYYSILCVSQFASCHVRVEYHTARLRPAATCTGPTLHAKPIIGSRFTSNLSSLTK
jgi:hypothetical protein